MVAWQGMHDAFDAAAYITESNIEGDVVEVVSGVEVFLINERCCLCK